MERTPNSFSGTTELPIATAPRVEQGWLRPVGFDPPAIGGSCSVVTPEGDCWCGTVLSVERPRVEVRLFGSNVLATFVGCKVAPLRPHSRADARQIFERQRQYQPAATFSKM
jgi:hypothetical protein